jgi:hypothetical protein
MKSMFLMGIFALASVYAPVWALDYNPDFTGTDLKTQCQTNRSALKTLIHDNLSTVKSNRSTFDQNHPDLKTLWKKKLTPQEKRSIQQQKMTTRLQTINMMTTFAKEYFSTLNTALIASTVSSLKTDRSASFATLASYVDPSKTTDYNTYVADFMVQFETNKTLRLTTYAEILKYIKHCGGAQTLHNRFPGLLNGLFHADHDRD